MVSSSDSSPFVWLDVFGSALVGVTNLGAFLCISLVHLSFCKQKLEASQCPSSLPFGHIFLENVAFVSWHS